MSNNNYGEKRGFARFPIEAQVTFTVNGDDTILYRGTSQNLSASGIYITTSYAAKLKDSIKIKLHSTKNHTHPLIAEGDVVRCKFDKENTDIFHISIKFSQTHEAWVQIITPE